MRVRNGIFLRWRREEDELLERIKKHHDLSIPRVALDADEIRAAERLHLLGQEALRFCGEEDALYSHKMVVGRFRFHKFILEKRKYVSRVHYYLIPFPPEKKEQQDVG